MTLEEISNKLQEVKSVEEIEALKVELKTFEEEKEAAEAKKEEITEEVKIEEEVKTEEVEKSTEEVEEEKGELISEEEERALTGQELVETKSLNLRKIEGETNMEKLDVNSRAYAEVWAKKVLGKEMTEEETRALGDAVTTTATTFVASAADTQGINNGGLMIPGYIRTEFLRIMSEQSPIFRDITKLQVAGNIDLPYLDAADDANWYVELTNTSNEGQEYKKITLTGHELAKNIEVTWKLEEMAIGSFLPFIINELVDKMGRALINAVIYGDGSNKATGITDGLDPVTEGDTVVDLALNCYKELSAEARVGARAYISPECELALVGYKDENGNYPFLQGIAGTKLVKFDTDPFLKGGDIVVGNAKNYILNTITPIRVDRDRNVKGRKTLFAGYAVVDGDKKPNSFVYGKLAGISL